jgi:hypothetical protein
MSSFQYPQALAVLLALLYGDFAFMGTSDVRVLGHHIVGQWFKRTLLNAFLAFPKSETQSARKESNLG